MGRHAVVEIPPKGKVEELPEELGMLSGELGSTDKVDDVLETLDLPAPGSADDTLGPAPEELEPVSEEEEREAVEESLSPEDPVRLYLREIGRISLLTA